MHLSTRARAAFLGGFAAFLTSGSLAAQVPNPTPPRPDSTARAGEWLRPLTPLASSREDRLRLEHLTSGRTPSGFLVRSTSTLSEVPDSTARGFSASVLAPQVQLAWNSALPFSPNEGYLWAGRGASMRLTTGVTAKIGPLSIFLAPEAIYAANKDIQTIPYADNRSPARHPLASPWYAPPHSLDLPSRPGTEPIQRIEPGQSSITLSAGPVSGGVSTENLWWGPGIRNAIVMSSEAAGFPHLFLRTREPLASPLGAVEGTWILGRLSESDFFDFDPENDHRSLSGLALVLRPAFDPDLSLGLARAVIAARPAGHSIAPSALDVFRSVGRPNSRPPEDSLASPRRDQVTSFFARWIFPSSGFEAYLEWARFEEPASFRDLLVVPQHSQGYTLGLQWARPIFDTSHLRLQTELTYLEPSSTWQQRPLPSTYASHSVEHGYTHRGRVLGAAIGPGASSQWLAMDVLAARWDLGAFAGRIRWNEAVHGSAIPIPSLVNHDVSVFTGARGGVRALGLDLHAEFTTGVRLNYLFQTRRINLIDPGGVDVRFTSLQLSVSPRLPR